MKHQRRQTSDHKIIDIYDEVFTQAERDFHLNFAYNSTYRVSPVFQNSFWIKDKNFFYSTFDNNDLNNFAFLSSDSFAEINKELVDYIPDRYYLNTASIATNSYYHVDYTKPGRKTLLYYLNERWCREWGGETLFTGKYGECEIAVEYKPGRIVIFDSEIEHKPAQISTDADEFRSVFVIQYRNKREQ